MSATPAVSSLPDADEMEARIIDALKTVFDPEIPVNIYELGLIYGLNVDPLVVEDRNLLVAGIVETIL